MCESPESVCEVCAGLVQWFSSCTLTHLTNTQETRTEELRAVGGACRSKAPPTKRTLGKKTERLNTYNNLSNYSI